MTRTLKERDNSIDILRFIGLSSIILAHIAPPNTLFQLRTFDVPLMVFISGLAYAGRTINGYGDFLKRRLSRLITPVYIFLCCYFLFNFILAQLGAVQQTPLSEIAGSFGLLLGYVWVIRVFLIIMLLTPLLILLERQVKSNWSFICLIATLFVVQYLVTEVITFPHSQIVTVVGIYIFYLAYSIPFLVGLRLRSAPKKSQWLLVLILVIAFGSMSTYLYITQGDWLIMQNYKYPPQPYFLLWGTLISSLLWVTKEWWQRLFEWKWVLFIAQNTIWIYLWHIPIVNITMKYLADAGWFTRFIVVYGLALFIFYLQSRLIDYIDKRGGDKNGFIKRYFKG